MIPTHYYLFLGAGLFTIGVVGVLTRRNVIVILMSIELILNAVNVNLIAFSRHYNEPNGQIFAIFVICFAVAEAAVVGYPHDIKGQGIYAYVTLKADVLPSEALKKELVDTVREEIGPIPTPDLIQWAPGLPKTRSGKIMRRILRKVAANSLGDLGDTSTLADPSVVDELINNRQNR